MFNFLHFLYTFYVWTIGRYHGKLYMETIKVYHFNKENTIKIDRYFNRIA